MGLDFSHCDASWAYSGFMRFRRRVAAAIGITNLDGMEGFGGSIPWSKYDDPIVPFLYHSDCDGELSPEECRVIAPRLREIVSVWPDKPFDYDKEKGLDLCDGMERAAKADEPLEFI